MSIQAAAIEDLLAARAAEEPLRPAYLFLAEGEREGDRLSFAELARRARAVAAELAARRAEGERVLLLFPPGLDFVSAFWGCLLAGAVAVPVHPPRRGGGLDALLGIVRDARPALALSVRTLSSRMAAAAPALAALVWVDLDHPAGAEPAALTPRARAPRPDDLALLQYTSGSTSAPKGVMVSRANLLHNQETIRRAMGQAEDSVIVTWLPPFHDMGLIGCLVQPLYVGARCVMMSPAAFLQRPARWLEAVSRYRASASGGPNFAYDLCAARVRPAERERLDLASWRVAFVGAEPVRAATLGRFARAFAPHGFRRESFYPCYGLAEATLFVAGGELERPPQVLPVAAEPLARGIVEDPEPGVEGSRGAVRLVGCGGAWCGQRVAIVDPATGRRCADRRVGEIWIAGPSVAGGYWEQPETSAATFGARLADEPGAGTFLRSGDLGFMTGGELFVTGRIKDLVIVRGRNLYPQDVELTAERSHPALRPGCGAAFGVDAAGEEQLVVVLEVERRFSAAPHEVFAAVLGALADEHQVGAHEVVLVATGTIPKTSSGKIQRFACRRAYLEGALAVVAAHRDRAPAPQATASIAVAAAEGEADAEALAGGPGEVDPRVELARLAPAERRGHLLGLLGEEIARVAGTPAGELRAERSLMSFGLDSLAAVELCHGLAERVGSAPALGRVLEGATVGELVAELEGEVMRVEGQSAPRASGEPPPENLGGPAPRTTHEPVLRNAGETEPWASAAVREAPSEGEGFPLSHGQQGIWFQQRLAPRSAAFTISVAVRVGPEVEVEPLEAAFAALLERHAALRFTISETAAGQVVQRAGPAAPGAIRREDAAGWPKRSGSASRRKPGARSSSTADPWRVSSSGPARPAGRCCCSPSTTWWPTIGRSRCWRRSWPVSIWPRRGWRSHCRPSRPSPIAITCAASASCWRARAVTSSSGTGAGAWHRSPASSCRATG